MNLLSDDIKNSLFCLDGPKHKFEELEKYYFQLQDSEGFEVNLVGIKSIKNWQLDDNFNFVHDSKKFFQVKGIRVSSEERENQTGWDQPILQEVNFDGGLLGLIRGIKDGLPHYLVEAKFEPGNYNQYQLSPTIQATFSNLEKAHGGREPHYFDLFKNYKENNESFSFAGWLSEDGGRLYNKRNYGLVKTVNFEDVELVNDNFNWFSFLFWLIYSCR